MRSSCVCPSFRPSRTMKQPRGCYLTKLKKVDQRNDNSRQYCPTRGHMRQTWLLVTLRKLTKSDLIYIVLSRFLYRQALLTYTHELKPASICNIGRINSGDPVLLHNPKVKAALVDLLDRENHRNPTGHVTDQATSYIVQLIPRLLICRADIRSISVKVPTLWAPANVRTFYLAALLNRFRSWNGKY
jgi:hypothetical protein